MDLSRKLSLKSFIRQSSSGGLSSGHSYQTTNTKKDAIDLPLNELRKDEFVNNYMKEKSSRESNSDPMNICNPDIESEILECIEDKYYEDITDPYMAEQLIFDDLPKELNLSYLIEQKTKLKKQLIVVSKKVSDLILKNETKYKTELERVTKLQTGLSDAIKVCTSGRKQLDCSKCKFTCVGLGIVASYRRREVLKSLLKALQTIKTLQETDVRLRELLEDDEDYTGAIQLYLECHKVVSSLKHYNCISELNTKLQDTLEMTEEQIDVALSKMCLTFNKDVYIKIMCAYNLLGKIQTAMDQLVMHFAGAIHNKAFSIVLGYVELFANNTNANTNAQNYHKRQYNELCKCLTTDSFLACLTDLCKALWDIMSNYYRILLFHREDVTAFSDNIVYNIGAENIEFDKEFVIQKLEHGLGRIWQDVQQKVRILIQNHNLAFHNFDEFIKILGVTEKMIEIGEEFCGNTSEDIQNSIHKQTINYFQNYHKSCMSELKVFLENEIWTLCSVPDFSLIDLKEFHFLRTQLPSQKLTLSPNSSPTKRQKYYFSKHFLQSNDKLKTPFDTDDDEEIDSIEVAINSSQHINNEDNDMENNCRKLSNGQCNDNMTIGEPIMTNTTLNVLRLFGKYIQMMSILRPIAFDAMICLFQLFDYYLYVVYKFFARDMLIMSDSSLANEMKITLKRIADDLLISDKLDTNAESHNNNNVNIKYETPVLSSLVNMSSPETLYGLAERVVAVESLVVLSTQFKYLQPYLDSLLTSDKKHHLNHYFNNVVSIASDLRKPIYMWVTVKCVQYEHIVSLMATTQWNIREILSMHNSYVDLLLRELQIFSMRLNQVFDKQLNGRQIPKDVYNILWDQILRLSNRTFVEGFSQSKKCSNEGRALMQLDFQQFLTKVDSLTTIKPIPERELVEEFIKAFYLTESALIEWIKTRKEYNPKQIHGLVNCITNDNKKMRSRILQEIDCNP
ncbi:syndetin-like [Oppia nitens]|uniref:syndetin-like n=1 Tax=Oppia nitens TaxID=1686743 RepID=UPI0023DC183A|nr:syndetin-like [Oppia nitens]